MQTKELRNKIQHTTRRALRTRSQVRGTSQRPRLSVQVSLRQVSAQIIDDTTGRTLAAASSLGEKSLVKSNLTAKATFVGEKIAEVATKVKVKQVVFDRGAKQYHGRVAALADAARQKGLEF